MPPVLLSIDVGTASLRSALVTPNGKILCSDQELILNWRTPIKMELSSDNIWQTLCHSVNRLLQQNPIHTESIAAIGIDTTASIALLDRHLEPVSLPDSPHANVIGWMDQRAMEQADTLSRQHPNILKGMGSRLIPENHTARMLWLQQNYPELWQQTDIILDLFDFLTMKCTGALTRTDISFSTRHSSEELHRFGISVADKLRGEVMPFGSPVADGLSNEAAKQLGLPTGTPVAAGTIDGYGGMLATILSEDSTETDNSLPIDTLCRRMSMIVGTSAVYVATSLTPADRPYCWGPWPSPFHGHYKYVIRQTAAGALIDHIVQSHPAFNVVQDLAISQGCSIYHCLNQMLKSIANGGSVSELTYDLHVLPYFAGNHCPRMDMSLKGMMSGLRIDKSTESLALAYLAVIQSIALGAKHNIEHLKDSGHEFDLLTAAGGLSKNPLFMQEHVNAMNIPACLPEEAGAMLLSGALTASLASGIHDSLESAMRAMSWYKEIIRPEASSQDYINRKYQVFLEMYEDQMKYKKIMGEK